MPETLEKKRILRITKYIFCGIILCALLPIRGVGQSSTTTVPGISPITQVLLGKLFSPGERDRINAALKLADYSHPQVVQALITVAKNDSSEMVKRVALKSLGRIGSFEALPVILESFKSDSIGIKVEAMGAAVNFSTLPVTNALINETDAKNSIIRQKAVTYLGHLKRNNNKVVDTIIKKLSDISEGVRVAACKVLGEKNIVRAIPDISQILVDDRSEVVRKYAAQALGEIKGLKARKVLKNTLDDSSPLVRITAAKSLALIDSGAGLSEAIQGIKSPDARIRVIACEVIGLVGNEDTGIFLEQAAHDFDRRVQRAAEKAITELKERSK